MTSNYKLAKIALQKEISLVKVLYCVILVIIITSLFYLYQHMYESTANKVINSFQDKDSLISKEFAHMPDTIFQIKKLKNQYDIIQKTKKPYLQMASNANTIWYTATNLFTMSSILLAILGFLIAKQGWDNNENFYLKSSFLILFFASTYFGLIPTVFNNKETGKYNTAKYFEYEKLQIDIYDLIEDNHRFVINKQYDKLDSAISQINQKLKSINDISFDIYIDKVPKEYNILQNQ